jgi:hypothetical protein
VRSHAAISALLQQNMHEPAALADSLHELQVVVNG